MWGTAERSRDIWCRLAVSGMARRRCSNVWAVRRLESWKVRMTNMPVTNRPTFQHSNLPTLHRFTHPSLPTVPFVDSSRVQYLIDPRLQIDNVRAGGPVTSPGEGDTQRTLQLDQLEPSLRARVCRPRGRWGEAGEWRESWRERRHERRADEPLHLIDEGALQVAAVGIDPDRTPGQLGKGAAPHVPEQIGDRIGRSRRLSRGLLGETREPLVLEQRIQNRALAQAHPLHETGRLDAPQDLGIEEERRRRQDVVIQELHRFRLLLPRHRLIDPARLARVLRELVDAAHHDRDVVHFPGPLG